ncbi:MAG: hypothetical protein AB1894_15655 [Chloroflexota bacterium]
MLAKDKGNPFTRRCSCCLLVFLILLLSGCSSPTASPLPPTAAQPDATATAPAPTATQAQQPTQETQSNGCPVGTAEAAAYTNNQDGYCLLVPNGFSISQPTEGLLIVSGPALDQSIESVQATLNITRIGSSGERALVDIAQEAWSGAREAYTQNTITLGGETAMLAEGLLIGEAEYSIYEFVDAKAGKRSVR